VWRLGKFCSDSLASGGKGVDLHIVFCIFVVAGLAGIIGDLGKELRIPNEL
jgi:hypothetical protein